MAATKRNAAVDSKARGQKGSRAAGLEQQQQKATER